MRNKPLVRFQLLILLIVAGLVIWRAQTGPSGLSGAIVFDDLEKGRLYRAGLMVDRDVKAVVSESVAYETDAEDAVLATYGWILNSRSGQVVWSTDVSKLARDGVLAVVADTIHLSPGSYEVFYTTLGPTERSISKAPFLGLTPYWTNHSSSLYLSVSEVISDTESRSLIAGESPGVEKRFFDGELWTTGPAPSHAYQTFLFRVRVRTAVRILAVGELCPTGCDYGWIENARSGEKVWQMEWGNTAFAGGMESNRRFDGGVELSPDIYRAVFRTNGSHAASSWSANPPYDPDSWGLTLYGVSESVVSEFDPWLHAKPILAMTQVGDDAHEVRQFRVNQNVSLLLYTVGEITAKGSLYDYAWLENDESGETVWMMSRENSLPAGGDGINRSETAFVDLAPGVYTLHFKSDGGHSFEGWIRTKPSHPERWGVTVFPVNDAAESTGAIEFLAGPEGEIVEGVYRVNERSVPALGDPIVSLVQVGNDADLYSSFTLDSESALYIIAQGEISPSGSWDYGWIEVADSEKRVWEMTLRNTVGAGGDDRNRRFASKITLPAGSYTARYVSDFSHAFGDFDDDKPQFPEEWGMRIYVITP